MSEISPWICFDFKDKTVRLTKYSVKSGGCHYLHDWVIEGSNDGSNWQELDRRNTQDLNEKFIAKTCECSRASGNSFRYLRLRQMGKNSGGNDQIQLSEIEFFGILQGQNAPLSERIETALNNRISPLEGRMA